MPAVAQEVPHITKNDPWRKKIKVFKGQSEHSAGREFTLHPSDPCLIPNTTYGGPDWDKSNPWAQR